MAARAFLFDLDGTLWRGHEWYALVLHEVAGLEMTTTMKSLAEGKNLFHLARKAGLSGSKMIAECHSRIDSLKMYDGVLPSLRQLLELDCKLGIVTNLPERIAGPVLADLGLNSFFEVTKFAAKKPRPTSLRAALADLGEAIDTRHCYVGDTCQDALCAANAGITFAWASYGYGILKPQGKIQVLQQFTDVVAL